eukprot:scaffold15034_cov181-Amphora_coffeaeformis.AAC.6
MSNGAFTESGGSTATYSPDKPPDNAHHSSIIPAKSTVPAERIDIITLVESASLYLLIVNLLDFAAAISWSGSFARQKDNMSEAQNPYQILAALSERERAEVFAKAHNQERLNELGLGVPEREQRHVANTSITVAHRGQLVMIGDGTSMRRSIIVTKTNTKSTGDKIEKNANEGGTSLASQEEVAAPNQHENVKPPPPNAIVPVSSQRNLSAIPSANCSVLLEVLL